MFSFPSMHAPEIRKRKKRYLERPDENGRKGQRPKLVGQLLGKSKWEKRLVDWIVATGVGFLGLEMCYLEDERMGRNDAW
jgi:hypothetical protein